MLGVPVYVNATGVRLAPTAPVAGLRTVVLVIVLIRMISFVPCSAVNVVAPARAWSAPMEASVTAAFNTCATGERTAKSPKLVATFSTGVRCSNVINSADGTCSQRSR